MISPSVDTIVDVETVLHIGMVYSLQGADIEIPWEAAPFSEHGVIGQACGDEVRDASELRTELEQLTQRITAKKHKELLAQMLAAEVDNCMARALQGHCD